ncbi:MAG: Fur family transcriptional regulator [Oscillatoriaceae cyanobacterium]
MVPVKPISSFEEALNRCRELGMRLSQQRRSILELLWEAREHMSAREIYDRLNREGKAIGHTSVYQNLEALSSQGIIECIERSDGRLYGNISDSHSHVNCIDTGAMLDVYVKLPKSLLQEVERQTGVRITDYRIDFYGWSSGASSPEENGGILTNRASCPDLGLDDGPQWPDPPPDHQKNRSPDPPK